MEIQPRLSYEDRTVLFFSRGRGHGHAIPDMAIADELARLRGDISLKFVSYGTGAKTFAAHGRPVIDLDLPDNNPVWNTAVLAGEMIRELQPCLVVSHEEFVVLPVAKMFGIPTVFITGWFSDPADLPMQALEYADQVICIEEPDIFPEPPWLEGRIHYVGPVMRRMNYGVQDRARARRELGFDEDALVIPVLPGGWTEDRAPIYDLVTPAFNALRERNKLLVWIAGEDYDALNQRLRGRSDVMVNEHDWQMDRLMSSADLAITKATLNTTRELAALGVPSISISSGLNPVDDIVIERVRTNTALDARTATPKAVANAIVAALRHPTTEYADGEGSGEQHRYDGARLAAERISELIEAVMSSHVRSDALSEAPVAQE